MFFFNMIADEIAKLFPGLYGQPSVSVVPDQSADLSGQKLKIGVVLSGGQAPGGHNVISGLFGKGLISMSKLMFFFTLLFFFCFLAFRLLAGAC